MNQQHYPTGRHPFHDPQSRSYGISAKLPGGIVRKRVDYALPKYFPLDQGTQGACVGFGWAGLLAAAPVLNRGTTRIAHSLYGAARREDALMGNNYESGATVTAGAKAAKSRVKEYRWAFTVDEIIDTLMVRGPLVMGTNWYDSMFIPDSAGLLNVEGDATESGHCWLLNGWIPDHPLWGEVGVMTNSWGSNWGQAGRAYILRAGLEFLMTQGGEACIATEVLPYRV